MKKSEDDQVKSARQKVRAVMGTPTTVRDADREQVLVGYEVTKATQKAIRKLEKRVESIERRLDKRDGRGGDLQVRGR